MTAFLLILAGLLALGCAIWRIRIQHDHYDSSWQRYAAVGLIGAVFVTLLGPVKFALFLFTLKGWIAGCCAAYMTRRYRVQDNKILVSGARRGTTGDCPNEVDHAEMVALRRLFRLDSRMNMREVTVFSTLEPCLMCFGALMISGIGKLVFAYEDAMGGGTGCDTSKMTPLYQSNQITVISGILRNESLKLLKTFFSETQNMYLQDSILAAYTLSQ